MLWHRVVLKCLRELPVASSTVFAFVKFFLIQCISAVCRKYLTVGSWYAGPLPLIREEQQLCQMIKN